MQVLRQAVVLAVIAQVRTIAAVEDFQFLVFQENLQVLLGVLLAFLLNQGNGLFECDGHGIRIFGE